MVMEISRRKLITSALAAGALASGSRYAFAADPLKVAFVYSSPVGDYGWSYRHDVGRQDLQRELGSAVETTFMENVPHGADAERVFSRLARSGHELIFTCSFGFMSSTLSAARQFPKTKFENNTGYETAENVAVYNSRFHEGRTVLGTIAAHMTKTGVIGYIGAFPVPEVIMGINAFMLAAQKVRPDIRVKVVWVNKWFDPSTEADSAKILVDNGADVILQHTNSTAPCQIAEERGVYCFGQYADMSAFAPTRHLTAIVDNWGPYYIRRAREVIEGKWQSASSWGGMAEGIVQIAPYNPVIPADVVNAAEAIKNDIVSGKLHPFAGPIIERSGKEMLAAGQVLSGTDIHSMNWFVRGIEGDLPV
jgi:simple sugar transport system substrate-binding protein